MKKAIGLALATASFGAVAAEWDKITPTADFRLRHENFVSEGGNSETQQRIRARLGFNYQVDKDLYFKTRLSTTGSTATSRNQDLDSDGGANAFDLDRAYVGKHFGDLHVHMGVMKNFYTRIGGTQIVWDSDVNLEGIHAKYAMNGLYLNVGSFNVEQNESDTKDGVDVNLLASQLGYKGDAGMVKYHLGVSNYHYANAHHNELDGRTGGTAEGINILETYAAVKFDVGMPVKVYFTAVTNNEAEDLNTGNAMGVKIGKAAKKGDWSLGFEQRKTEQYAVYDALNDSNFAKGEANSEGSIISAAYKTCDKSKLKLSVYSNKRNIETTETDYSSTKVDFIVKF